MYWGDYLRDTSHLSAAEHGAYLLLIGHYWTSGAPLPADDGKLARIARMAGAEWKRARDTIAEFFQVADAQWTHRRIDEELAKAAKRYAERALGAQIANAKRDAERTAERDADEVAQGAVRVGASPSPSPSHSPIGDGGSREPPTRARKRPSLDTATQAHFEEWWKHFPHKVAKPAAERAFAVAITKASLADLILGAQRYAKMLAQPNAPSPKYPQGWLNDERWNDEIPTREPQNGHAPPHHDQGHDALRAGLAAAAAARMGSVEPAAATGDPRDRDAGFG